MRGCSSSAGGAHLLVAAPLFWWNRPSSAGARSSARAPSSARPAQLLLKVLGYVCWGHCSFAGDLYSSGDAPLPLGTPHLCWGRPPAPLLLDEPNFCSRCPFCIGAPLFLRHPSPGRAPFPGVAPLSAGAALCWWYSSSAGSSPLLLDEPNFCLRCPIYIGVPLFFWKHPSSGGAPPFCWGVLLLLGHPSSGEAPLSAGVARVLLRTLFYWANPCLRCLIPTGGASPPLGRQSYA